MEEKHPYKDAGGVDFKVPQNHSIVSTGNMWRGCAMSGWQKFKFDHKLPKATENRNTHILLVEWQVLTPMNEAFGNI